MHQYDRWSKNLQNMNKIFPRKTVIFGLCLPSKGKLHLLPLLKLPPSCPMCYGDPPKANLTTYFTYSS